MSPNLALSDVEISGPNWIKLVTFMMATFCKFEKHSNNISGTSLYIALVIHFGIDQASISRWTVLCQCVNSAKT